MIYTFYLMQLDQRATQDRAQGGGKKVWEVLCVQDDGSEPHWDEGGPP